MTAYWVIRTLHEGVFLLSACGLRLFHFAISSHQSTLCFVQFIRYQYIHATRATHELKAHASLIFQCLISSHESQTLFSFLGALFKQHYALAVYGRA